MTQKLKDKIALITGGNSGIGLATAKEYAEQGAPVIITGRNQEALDKSVSEIGGNSYSVQGDVSNPVDLDRLYNVIKDNTEKSISCLRTRGLLKLHPSKLYPRISSIAILISMLKACSSRFRKLCPY